MSATTENVSYDDHPMVLTLKVRLMVNQPKVAVTEIDGKGMPCF